MSPEQARGLDSLDHRCDLWALAVVAYEALTRSIPWEGETVEDIFLSICTHRMIPILTRRGDLPPAIEGVFARSFAPKLDDRFRSAMELSEAFEVLVDPMAVDAAMGPAVRSGSPSSRQLPAARPHSSPSLHTPGEMAMGHGEPGSDPAGVAVGGPTVFTRRKKSSGWLVAVIAALATVAIVGGAVTAFSSGSKTTAKSPAIDSTPVAPSTIDRANIPPPADPTTANVVAPPPQPQPTTTAKSRMMATNIGKISITARRAAYLFAAAGALTAGPPAFSSTQGTLGATSTGSVSITASVANRAPLTGLTDISFSAVDPATAAPSSQSDCVWSELGRLREEMLGDHDSAVLAWEASQEADPENEESAMPLADEYITREAWDRAEPLLDTLTRKAGKRDRGEQHTLYNKLGMVTAKLGKDDKSFKAYSAAHQLDLTDPTSAPRPASRPAGCSRCSTSTARTRSSGAPPRSRCPAWRHWAGQPTIWPWSRRAMCCSPAGAGNGAPRMRGARPACAMSRRPRTWSPMPAPGDRASRSRRYISTRPAAITIVGVVFLSRVYCVLSRCLGAGLVALSFVLLASPAWADQTVMAADGSQVDCAASAKDLTRISLVEDEFASVSKISTGNPQDDFSVVNEPVRGDIYLSVPDGFTRPALSFFATSKRGYVYKIVCRIAGDQAVQLRRT
ncbi:TraK domain-containing protein [Escherichia coli]|nr:type-F conjugative transfer system secretin TraK [Escherichia coli]